MPARLRLKPGDQGQPLGHVYTLRGVFADTKGPSTAGHWGTDHPASGKLARGSFSIDCPTTFHIGPGATLMEVTGQDKEVSK